MAEYQKGQASIAATNQLLQAFHSVLRIRENAPRSAPKMLALYDHWSARFEGQIVEPDYNIGSWSLFSVRLDDLAARFLKNFRNSLFELPGLTGTALLL